MGCKSADPADAPASPLAMTPGVAHNFMVQQLGNNSLHVIDVRTTREFNDGHIEGARHIDWFTQSQELLALNKTDTYIVYCHSGNRSQKAAAFMRENGFKRVINMTGGIQAWRATMPSLTPSPQDNVMN
jgi:rhodanese-related sulfurtransferase